MGRIVVIDDLRIFGAFEAEYARSSAAGLRYLRSAHQNSERIDQLWLDHDLGGTDDIRVVVDWLLERCVWEDMPDIGEVVVHTSNPPAAEMMTRALSRWYRTRRVDAACYDVSSLDSPAE